MTGSTSFEASESDSQEIIHAKQNTKLKFIHEIESTFTSLFEFVQPAGAEKAPNIHECKIPALMFIITSLSRRLSTSLYDDVETYLCYEGQDPKLIQEIFSLLAPSSSGVPHFEAMVTQMQKTRELPTIVETAYFPAFMNTKGLLLEEYTVEDLYKAIGITEQQLQEELEFKNEEAESKVSYKLSKIYHHMFSIRINRDIDSMQVLIGMVAPLFSNNPGMLKILQACYYMVIGEKKSIFDVLPVILKLAIHCLASSSHSIKLFALDLNDQILDGIVNWFLGIMGLLNKDKRVTTQEIADMIVQMVEIINAITAEMEKSGKPLPVIKSIGNMADAMIGIISLCKGDFTGMERIAKLVGGYDRSRMEGLLKILEKYGSFLTGGDSKFKGRQDSLFNAVQQGDQIGLKEMFKLFDKDKGGTLDFGEFCELCKYMGLFLTRETLLQLYAEADENDNNSIEFDEFVLSINILKRQVGRNALESLGLSREQLI